MKIKLLLSLLLITSSSVNALETSNQSELSLQLIASSSVNVLESSNQSDLEQEFENASKIHSIPVEMLVAIAKIESNFNVCAISKAGAVGMMQLMRKTALSHHVLNPFDRKQSISGAASYLRLANTFIKKTKVNTSRVSQLLSSYNYGPRAIKLPYKKLPLETRAYVIKGLNVLEEINSVGWREFLSQQNLNNAPSLCNSHL
jgi:soluble lytic murein transglycosylase-like protein